MVSGIRVDGNFHVVSGPKTVLTMLGIIVPGPSFEEITPTLTAKGAVANEEE